MRNKNSYTLALVQLSPFFSFVRNCMKLKFNRNPDGSTSRNMLSANQHTVDKERDKSNRKVGSLDFSGAQLRTKTL